MWTFAQNVYDLTRRAKYLELALQHAFVIYADKSQEQVAVKLKLPGGL